MVRYWLFSNVSSSLYKVTVRPSDGARLHETSCLHDNCSAEPQHVQHQIHWNTLQEVEWTWKENTAKLFIHWILGRSAIVSNYVSFWTAWQHLPELKSNGTDCWANQWLEIFHCQEDFLYQLLQFTPTFYLNKTEETNQKLEFSAIHIKTCRTEHLQVAFVSNIVRCLIGQEAGIQVTWTHWTVP